MQDVKTVNLISLCFISLFTGELVFLIFNSYFEFDKVVMREILGKKMSAKLRKDMEDVSEKTNVSLKSCRRQVFLYFRNATITRIFCLSQPREMEL